MPVSKRFVPPTPEEVAAYCQERHNGIDGSEFCDFYTSKGWKVGKNQMKDWKAAVRIWERSRQQTATTERKWIDSVSYTHLTLPTTPYV